MKQERADVVIAGAGYVGLALAAALARTGLDVAVCDPVFGRAPPADPRASALVPGARNLLATIGAWDAIEKKAQPVARMEISDARLAEIMRTVLLTFDGGDEPVAWIVPNAEIREALLGAAQRAGARFVPSPITGAAFSGVRARVDLAGAAPLTASLLVAAEGANSPLRTRAKIRMQGWRYDQAAIVTTVRLERDHESVAVQHFLEGGPFALLPLPDGRASVVWAERRLDAQRLYELPDEEFIAALQERAGYRFGALSLDGPRGLRPLELKVARSFVSDRLALIGDAAHIVHPLAGQGMNIGFRDVAALAECVIDAARLGGDIGARDVLARFERWRRFDTMAMLAGMDGLLKLFTLPGSAARLVRDAGMGAFDRMPGIKGAVMTAAAGLSGEVPRLLRGEVL